MLSKISFNLIKNKPNLKIVESLTASRSYSDQCSIKDNKTKVNKNKTKDDTCSISKNEKLAKPSKPSNKYEAPQYFGYNVYSYNDLISDMEKYRNPQPSPK